MHTNHTFDPASAELYQRLAHLMNTHPEHYRVLGDADMVAAFTVTGPDSNASIQLVFAGLACEGVDEVVEAEAALADFRLVGPASAWTAMFDDIVANGRASGEWTINSLALRADRIRLLGDDPMGLDKFSRFNQTLQEFLDGAGLLEAALAGTAVGSTASTTRSDT